MKNKLYHVCFVLDNELCTGTNIESDSYINAITKFNKSYPDKDIIYVCLLYR